MSQLYFYQNDLADPGIAPAATCLREAAAWTPGTTPIQMLAANKKRDGLARRNLLLNCASWWCSRMLSLFQNLIMLIPTVLKFADITSIQLLPVRDSNHRWHRHKSSVGVHCRAIRQRQPRQQKGPLGSNEARSIIPPEIRAPHNL
jgi:hypothetical protein